MTLVRSIVNVLASKAMLFWLIALWFLYYMTVAVWGSEAFDHFVAGVRDGFFFKVPFLLCIVNLLVNLVRRGIANSRKSVLSFLLWVPLALGVVLLPLAFFVSTNFKQTERIIAGEGDTVTSIDGAGLYTVKAIHPHLKDSVLDMDEGKAFFSHEPQIVLSDGNADFNVGVYPPRKLGSSYFHIMEFGLAPGIRIVENGTTLIEGYMPQRILPPGSSDLFTVNGLPYRFEMKLSPEKTIEKGNVAARVYSLRAPAYNVRILAGEQPVWEGISASQVRFGRYTLSFFEPGYWVRIEIVQDYAAPFLLTAISFIIAGVPARLALLMLERKGTCS